MTTIATLAVKLIADNNGFISAMDQAERKSQTWSQNVSKNLKEVGGNITNFGKMATMGLTLPILAAGVAAVNYASNMEETKSKVGVVFGEMSSSVLAWSEDAATAMGISQEQALAAAGTYGNLFVSLGLGQQPAADMSTALVGLASDLASFNNANPEDVLLALQSGLSGEIEPLKKFGIAMNEAILTNKAMEMGMGDNLQVLTEAQKLQLRYAVIMEQTTTAQGDFARTSEGLANSTRIAKAQLADAAVVLGQQLLPYALKLVNWITLAIAWFQQLTPEQQKWMLIILGTVAVIGPLLVVVGSLVTAIGAIIPVIAAVGSFLAGFALPIIAIIAVLALLYLAWTNNWGGIQEKTAAAWEFIKGVIAGGWAFIQQVFQTAMTALAPLMAAFTAAREGDWYAFGENLRKAWDNVWKLITTAVSTAWMNIKTAMGTLIKNAIDLFKKTDWGAVGKSIVEGIANGITSAIDWIIAAVITMGQAVLDAIRGFLGISSPSKVMANVVGKNMALGVVQGWNQYLQPLAFAPAMGSVTGMRGGGQRSAVSGQETSGGMGMRLVNYGTLIIRTDGQDVQKDILRQLQGA